MLLTTGQSPGNAGRSGRSLWVATLAILLLVGDGASSLVWAQADPDGRQDSLNLIPRYRMARYQFLAQQFVDQMPMRVFSPTPLPTSVDSLLRPTDSTEARVASTQKEAAFQIEALHEVSDLERSWFQNQYGDTEWSFLGSRSRLTILDTTRTRELRARLQTHFGDPTHTPAEVNLNEWSRQTDSTRENLVQFAYWFVVNDSIPVRVTDVNGPMGRGLIVSTDRAYRDHLVALRNALLQPLRREERSPCVDYYYDDGTRRWYRVGFDGTSFFREHISRRDIVRGRRPKLETDRSSPASSSGSSS